MKNLINSVHGRINAKANVVNRIAVFGNTGPGYSRSLMEHCMNEDFKPYHRGIQYANLTDKAYYN